MRVSGQLSAISKIRTCFLGIFIAAIAATVVLASSPRETKKISKQDGLLSSQSQPGRSYLGVKFKDITVQRAKELNLGDPQGVEIIWVMEGSPADKAGLKPGDVLLAYNGENILGGEQLVRLVAETPAGRKIKIQYWRDGKTQTAAVVTSTPPRYTPDIPSSWPSLPNVPMPNFNLYMRDIPDPLLVWHNNMLGIEGEPLSAQLAGYFGVKGGVLVRSVDRASPADKAGLKAGDVIIGAAGAKNFDNPRDFISFLRTQHPGSRFELALMRDHRELKVNFKLPDNQ